MIKQTFNRLYSYTKKHYLLIIFFAVLLVVYYANTIHETFPDEYDNIVGGWYITRGILPYTGFFSHHNPGAYVISSLIVLFTRQSFVWFRYVWGVILFIAATSTYFYFRKQMGDKDSRFLLLYLWLVGVGATYFWGQMMLSETVVGYALIPAYLLVFWKSMHLKPLTLRDLMLVSVCTFISLFTSFTYLYTVGFFLLYIAYYYLRYSLWNVRKIAIGVGIFALPYIIFFLYLLMSQSLSRFYFSSIVYNRDYYIYNFPIVAGQVSKNPARYALSIFYETSLQYYSLFHQVNDFNLAYPANITFVLGNVTMLAYLLTKRKFSLAILIYMFMIYLNSRSQPLDSKETDFHSTVYIMFSLLNISYVIFELLKELSAKIKHEPTKVFYYALLGLLGVYTFFLGQFFTWKFVDKTYSKVMGRMPAIYDQPVAAPVINKLVSKDDYFWIGPFEFQELLYINGKLPSKYHWFLPANERSEKIRTELVEDLNRNKPKVVVFKDYLSYFGTIPSDYNYPIMNFLRPNYFKLNDLKKEGKNFKLNIMNLHNFDLETDFYFDLNRKEEIYNQLVNQGIITPQP